MKFPEDKQFKVTLSFVCDIITYVGGGIIKIHSKSEFYSLSIQSINNDKGK